MSNQTTTVDRIIRKLHNVQLQGCKVKLHHVSGDVEEGSHAELLHGDDEWARRAPGLGAR